MNEHGPVGGGASGPDEDAYYMMMHGDCSGALSIAEGKGPDRLLEPLRSLYLGAGSACLAAFEDRGSLWPRAEAAFERTAGTANSLDCEHRAVFELLRRLVQAHRADPSARLVKRVVGRRALVCPYFTKISPNHGPEAGGYTVQIEGRNLPNVVSITWVNEYPHTYHLEAVSQDGRHLVITVPPGSHSAEEPAYVTPDGARTWTDSGVHFTYDPPVAGAQSSSSSSTTTTSSTSTTGPEPAEPSSTAPAPPSS